MATVVHPPVSERALAEFEGVLGGVRVLTEPAALREYRDPFQFETWENNTAVGRARPRRPSRRSRRSSRIAGRHGVPLWTHAQGRNNGYGGPRRASGAR